MSSISGQIEDAIRALRGARLMDHEADSVPHHFACAKDLLQTQPETKAKTHLQKDIQVHVRAHTHTHEHVPHKCMLIREYIITKIPNEDQKFI